MRVKPGAVREIHWHTTSDEWNFFIGGSARIGIYVRLSLSLFFFSQLVEIFKSLG